MKNLTLILLFMFFTSYIQAQHPEAKRANYWYFGNGAGLDFSNGNPVAITNGQLDSWESCASISDINGNLLFYTDGDTVWTRNHTVMPNGTGLYGNCYPPGPNNSATQGVIIIPQPNSSSIFYVFTVDCAENLGAKGMNYSVVDLSLNGGLGDITLKNQFLFAPSTEGMAATMNCARDSIWVVGHDDNDLFYSYLVTKNGLSTTPIISIANSIFNLYGQMKFSPNNKKIAYQGYIYNFNFSNGAITNGQLINFDGYGLSFSPDSKKLYYSIGGYFIGQFDITYNNVTDILNSFQIVYQGISNDGIYGLQIGIDSKLYVANIDTTKISTIDNPNNTGSAAGFNPYSVDLNGRKSQFTFPSFIENYFDQTYTLDSCSYESPTIITDTLIIPNIFTPNNDNTNDVFSITLSGYKNIAWKIYNRWGMEMINGKLGNLNTTTVELWDGRTNSGTKALEGTYYYIINLTRKEGENETKKGFITLIN